MQNISGEVLEFESLRELMARYVPTALGQAELAKVAPHTDRERLEEGLAEAEEATQYLRAVLKPQPAVRGAAIHINFVPMPDLVETVHKLRIEGAVLEPKEFLGLIEFLDHAADAKSILQSVTERFPRLGARSRGIGDFRQVLNDVAGTIQPDGTVADHASVALGRLRRDIERQRKVIQDSLERFLRAHHEEGVLQEEFVTIRNERFVVPVISGQRRRIDGVIHGASASGHTLFVEPLETIELNNDLVRLTEEEMREVHRILRELSERLRGHADSILATLGIMGELELVFAKARFAMDFDCVRPRFSPSDRRRIVLKRARHPLLEQVLRPQRKRVVPVSLELNADFRTLLISGPNTGGKTVTLKTIGLLALMAQSGIPVPCEDAEFPVFEQVLADIGDNQSIQQNLSTFSAHISRIRDMIFDATPDSLVLLDELGSATDPEEGGALGVAVIDHFRAAGAITLASTHLVALKIYGANTNGVLNASMGFDEETLEPTYELHMGLPGKSAGLDIAARLGMPESIMRRARESMSDRERQVSQFLTELHRRLEETGALETRLKQTQEELSNRGKELAAEWQKREAEKLKELERRCDAVLAKFDAQAQEAIERIAQTAERRKAVEQAQRSVSKSKRELREEFNTTVLSTEADARAGGLSAPKIEEGTLVRLRNVREPARVRRLLGPDRIEVEAGFMKMQVSLDDVLEVLPATTQGTKLPKNVSYRPAPELNPMVQEINVIGERAEEACEHVEKFLDSAVMSTASRVRIVHGHGMGILRKAIWSLLGSSPHVARFYQAQQHEGGAGATIVELKD
ncbi:MAG: endonuclease MutS2 [Acidobacteria bacterium]|nr:MAG: endonuclease MutS2 [Acidobacteriota bacterium]